MKPSFAAILGFALCLAACSGWPKDVLPSWAGGSPDQKSQTANASKPSTPAKPLPLASVSPSAAPGLVQWSAVHDRVYFADGQTALSPDAIDALKDQAIWLEANPSATVTIEGHADDRGDDRVNVALGWRRADAVKAELTTLGIAAARIATVSYGQARPAAMGNSSDARAQNRRAVTVIAP